MNGELLTSDSKTQLEGMISSLPVLTNGKGEAETVKVLISKGPNGEERHDESTVRVALNLERGGIAGRYVASVNLRVKDWAVYYGGGTPEEVGSNGDKISEHEARRIFPQFSGFAYRP